MEFASIILFLEKIQLLTNWSKQDFEILKKPHQTSTATLNVNGKQYPAYRILYSNSRGPGKGGIRYHPEVDENEVKALSFWMALKTATVNIPFGGAKGGISVDPKRLSLTEIEMLSREYIKAFYKVIGPHKDIPAPDIYTTPQIMAWMMDEYENLTGTHEPGVITGKPLELGGSLVRNIATAQGGVFVLEEAIKKLEIKNKDVIIQGFGNAGMTMAKLLDFAGYNIVGVSDSHGAIYNPDGLNITRVIEVKNNKGKVSAYANATQMSNKEILLQECSILVPAALANQITVNNAQEIKAKIVVELANGPTTLEADSILHSKNILVIPDILANAGGVTVSYFEWVQNNYGYYWDEKTVLERLKKKMIESFETLWSQYSTNKHDLRTNAYILAINKILNAEKLRGRI